MSLDRMQSQPGMVYITPLPDSSSGTTVPGGVCFGSSAGFVKGTTTTPSGGGLFFQGVAQQTLTNNAAITHANCGKIAVTNAGAVTGITIQAGSVDGQVLFIIMKNTAANTITFNATPATSLLANSASTGAVAGLKMLTCVWDATAGLWYANI